ncbi:PLP-dependent aminotransferase family protein [Spirochaeta isovalerica]|uniref:2-aminoadipate transaminase n=1 Tax=Spirochaeta isovalerica TaxID=150 RepID=A0A841RED6_9SPIO|nr:PLP-dependent aminotransferase family protein [Spirochaeta isovalerica]MBB6480712.1 2-aminoadipate transaminase [Spirochaeta isovalerica]
MFSKRVDGVKASEIREILKLAARNDIISFAGGLPAPELFPVEKMKEVSRYVLDNMGEEALQYSPTEGYVPLRDFIAGRMAKTGYPTNRDEILIISGSQQGLDFAGKIFLNPGDTVLCESPTYLGAVNAFRAYEGNFREVDTDDEGMIPEDLEKALKETDNVKFIYVIPDFQNPSGRTWSLERRKALIELAGKYRIPVVEDNPYGELIFEGERQPSIKSLDTEGLVMFLGTFSKTFAPGLRIGWICASPEILSKCIMVKQSSDVQSSSISQREIAVFMEKYDFEEHVETIKKTYKKRRDLMMESIEKYFPEEAKWTYPSGGLFTWVVVPESIDTKELMERTLEETKVAYVPGASFFPNGGVHNTLRLNFSNMPEDKIVEGIRRLGDLLKKEIAL